LPIGGVMKTMALADLSTSAACTLIWLTKADSSPYGECKGAGLDELVRFGLARIKPSGPLRIDQDYRRVVVTKAGHSVAALGQRDFLR
jgi:hypothetical protein